MKRWSVRSFFKIDWQWPRDTIKPLENALDRRVEVVDRNKYKLDSLNLVTLHFDGEMDLRDLHGSKVFKGRLFFAHPGDVIYSKIDVRNGAVGVVYDEIGTVAVTSEYPVYRIKPEIALPQYIQLLFRASFFRNAINSMISGTSGRKRVQPSQLERIEVPIPPLPIQQKIVAIWEKTQMNAAAAREKIAQLERDIEAEFLTAIGVETPPFICRDKHFVLPWTVLERWSVEFNRWDWSLGDIFKEKHPLHPLEKFAWVNPSRTSTNLKPSAKVSFVPMEAVDAESGEIVAAEERELAEVTRGFTAFQNGDVIWAKITPCMQNGKCALAKGLTNGVGYGSTEFHVIRSKDTTVLNPEFLWTILRLRRLQEAAQRYFIGSAGQQRVSAEFLRELPIPIIPIAAQHQIVKWITEHRKEIAKIKVKAKTAMEAATADVEAMILGTKGFDNIRSEPFS